MEASYRCNDWMYEALEICYRRSDAEAYGYEGLGACCKRTDVELWSSGGVLDVCKTWRLRGIELWGSEGALRTWWRLANPTVVTRDLPPRPVLALSNVAQLAICGMIYHKKSLWEFHTVQAFCVYLSLKALA